MNNKLNEFKNDIKGKNVAVLGIGISNIPAIKYLISLGAKITARDVKDTLDEECDELKELDIEFILGKDYLKDLSNYDYILRSPGIKPFEPEIEKAVENGVILTSEIELLIELADCKIIGVTGSDGKTTTTTLISKFLQEAGYKVWMGGNIGIPLFSKIDDIKENHIIVLELSSFQLMTLRKSPNIAVITNISPNHLNYHRSYEEYIDAKSNIFMKQSKEDILVLNKDDEFFEKYLGYLEDNNIKAKIRNFSIKRTAEKGVFLRGENIISNVLENEEIICNINEVKLLGMHNIANICAAASAVIHITGIEAIRRVVTTFIGVEHRMEFIREINSVRWYNDSIGSSPSRTIAGLVSFKDKIILIAGGYDKDIPYDVIGPYILDKVKILLLIGKTAPKIEAAVLKEAVRRNIEVSEHIIIVNLNSLEECVEYAYKNAKSGDFVVMSPASASFDMYKNFEERGRHFKYLVKKLKE